MPVSSPTLRRLAFIAGVFGMGAFSEVILASAGIGISVTMFPIIKRQKEALLLPSSPRACSKRPSSSAFSPWCSKRRGPIPVAARA
jgi:hypothetical protein